MSAYYDDRRTSARDRRRDYDYDDDAVYTNTRDNQKSTAMVRRRSISPDYDEEVRRDFSPGGGGYYRETITRKSGTRPAGTTPRARSYNEDRYFDDDRSHASSRRDPNYGVAAAGRRSEYGDRRPGRKSRHDDYSDSSRSRSRTPPKRERRKSMPEEALEAIGLGGIAAKFLGKKDRSRSSSRDRRSGSRSGRSRRGSPSRSGNHNVEQLQQALKAAVLAGAGAAFRARQEPGGWGGEKGKRVLTAALTAGGVDGFINRDKDPEQHKFRDTIASAAAGIAADRAVNGPRSKSRGPDGRRISPDRRGSRSRSRAGNLLSGAAIAAAAKKAADSFSGRSSSRGRDRRSRSSSSDRYDSRSPPRQGLRSRSRSVVGRALSKIGLDKQADRVDPARERSRSRGPGGRSRTRSRSRGRYADDDLDSRYGDRRGNSLYDPPPNPNGRGSSIYDNREVRDNPSSNTNTRALNSDTGAMMHRPHSVGPGGGVFSPPPHDYRYDTEPRKNGDPETDSDSDLGSSSEDEKDKNKGRKRLVVSGGLATVATIHAGNSIYASMKKREARKSALRDGTISKEEAAKHKSRDRLQDAASVGLAALGVKGAYSEWKEIKEKHEEWKEEKEKLERHAKKREARKQKLKLVGMQEGASNSAPVLGEPYYGNWNGPYMSGADVGIAQPQPQYGQGPMMNAANNNAPQYYDDNPYGGWAGQQPQQQQQYNPAAGYHNADTGGFSGNGTGPGNGYGNYAPPQRGSGFPPPPGGQPPPPQGR